jgi:hypothetical protein
MASKSTAGCFNNEHTHRPQDTTVPSDPSSTFDAEFEESLGTQISEVLPQTTPMQCVYPFVQPQCQSLTTAIFGGREREAWNSWMAFCTKATSSTTTMSISISTYPT